MNDAKDAKTAKGAKAGALRTPRVPTTTQRVTGDSFGRAYRLLTDALIGVRRILATMTSLARLLLAATCLLVLPTAPAASVCGSGICVQIWSFDGGACGGWGVERNVVDVDLQTNAGAIRADAETFCYRIGRDRYQETSGGVVYTNNGNDRGASWTWHESTPGACTIAIVVVRPLEPPTRVEQRCPTGAGPPAVPALLD